MVILGMLSRILFLSHNCPLVGIHAIPTEFWEVMRNHELKTITRLRRVILPTTFPYPLAGLFSTINSAWRGIAIVEYSHNIYCSRTLVQIGIMKLISYNANGNVGIATWTSLLFAIICGIFFKKSNGFSW